MKDIGDSTEKARVPTIQEQQCSNINADQPPSKEVTSSDGTPNSSPHKSDGPSKGEISCYINNDPPDGAQQNEAGRYDNQNGEYDQRQNDYNIQGNSSDFVAPVTSPAATVQQNSVDETSCMGTGGGEQNEEGSLFEDSNGYGEEIVKWMEDQRRLQQQQLANGKVQQSGADDSSIVLPEEPTTVGTGTSINEDQMEQINASDAGGGSSKRPSSAMSNSSSSQKPPAKRRQRAQSTSQATPPENRSASRVRMDNALHERSQSQRSLRMALLALEKAKAVVGECRSRYNAAKNLVENTAREEYESLLLEDSQWNEMFHKLKVSAYLMLRGGVT